MDWKFGYGDDALDTWTVGDVGEFLFGWCPRKLSAGPEESAEIPVSVAAFVEFLVHTGQLARGSDLPSEVRRYCERNTAPRPGNHSPTRAIFASPTRGTSSTCSTPATTRSWAATGSCSRPRTCRH